MANGMKAQRPTPAVRARIVLIVEDTEEMRNLLVHLVREVDPHLVIDQAETVKEGLAWVRRRLEQHEQYAAVVLDLKLPADSGENAEADTHIYAQVRRAMPAAHIIQYTPYTNEESLRKNFDQERRNLMGSDRYFLVNKLETHSFSEVKNLLHRALAEQDPPPELWSRKQFGFLVFARSESKRRQLTEGLAEAVPEAAIHGVGTRADFQSRLNNARSGQLNYDTVVIDLNDQGRDGSLDNLALDVLRMMPRAMVVYLVADSNEWLGRLGASPRGVVVLSHSENRAERETLIQVVREHNYGGRIEKQIRKLFESHDEASPRPSFVCAPAPERSRTLELAALARDIEEHWFHLSPSQRTEIERYFRVDAHKDVRAVLR